MVEVPIFAVLLVAYLLWIIEQGPIQMICENVGESDWWLTGINQKQTYVYEQVCFGRVTC